MMISPWLSLRFSKLSLSLRKFTFLKIDNCQHYFIKIKSKLMSQPMTFISNSPFFLGKFSGLDVLSWLLIVIVEIERCLRPSISGRVLCHGRTRIIGTLRYQDGELRRGRHCKSKTEIGRAHG